jgi:hypothetical protein
MRGATSGALRRGIAGGRAAAAMRAAFILLCAPVGTASIGASADPPSQYTWVPPLPAPLRLTGTLGESRGDHLHSGIDLSTGGVTGQPVRAVAPGTITRLRANASSYGRALYLETRVGLVAVYGHLERFEPQLEAYLREIQQASGEYETDVSLRPGRFTFAAGETLAWSGESGAGPPHLHFELRRGEIALNPLDLGIEALDLAPPQLPNLVLRALGARGWVDGGLERVWVPPAGAAPRVYGPVGIECTAIDPCGVTEARLAPRSLRLFLDGRVVFARGFDEVDFGRRGDVARIYTPRETDGGAWSYRLFHWPADADTDVSEESQAPSGGCIDFSTVTPGEHVLCVEATDACGSVTEVKCPVSVVAPPRVCDWKSTPDGRGGWLVGARLAEPLDATTLPPHLRIAGAGDTSSCVPPLALGAGWFVWSLAADAYVQVCERSGCPLLPLIRVGGAQSEGGGGLPALHAWIDTGLFAMEVCPQDPFADVPQAFLVDPAGGRVPLEARGIGKAGGWLFALDTDAFVGRAESVHLTFAGLGQELELPMPLLIGFMRGANEPLQLPLPPGCGPLTLIPTPDTFAGSTLMQVRVASGGDSAWATVLGPEGRPRAREQSGELRAISPLIELAPAWWPLAGPLGLFIACDTLSTDAGIDEGCWGLYRQEAAGHWSRVGRESQASGRGAWIAQPGRYVLMVDRTAPRMIDPAPADGGVLSERPATLGLALEEHGAGLDVRASDILLDGQMLIAAWDIDARTLSAEIPAGMPPGEHGWEVRAVDRAGNASARAFSFTWGVH